MSKTPTPGRVMLNPLLPNRGVTAWIARIANLGARSPFGVWFARSHVRVSRRTNGRVGGRWLGAPVLLLEVAGRRTGELRETPMIYLQVRDVAVVMPANAGQTRPPLHPVQVEPHDQALTSSTSIWRSMARATASG